MKSSPAKTSDPTRSESDDGEAKKDLLVWLADSFALVRVCMSDYRHH